MLMQILRDCGNMKILNISYVLRVGLDFLKTHTEITLFTLQSEYVVLSHYIRGLPSWKNVIRSN